MERKVKTLKIGRYLTLRALTAFLWALFLPLVMYPYAASAGPAPTATQGLSAAEHAANARKTDADARKSNADARVSNANADKAIAETKRAEVALWFDDITAFFLKVVLPLVAVIVILKHLNNIGAFLASRAWNVSAPGGLSFGVTSAISAAITNVTTNPPDSLTAPPAKIKNATSTVAAALQHKNLSFFSLSKDVLGAPDKQPGVAEAMRAQSDYFVQAYGGLLASQYAMLKAASEGGGALGMPEVTRIYHFATGKGLVLTLRDWLNYLVKWQFITAPSDYSSGTTELTDLGKHFYQWMLVNGHTPTELIAIGHGT